MSNPFLVALNGHTLASLARLRGMEGADAFEETYQRAVELELHLLELKGNRECASCEALRLVYDARIEWVAEQLNAALEKLVEHPLPRLIAQQNALLALLGPQEVGCG